MKQLCIEDYLRLSNTSTELIDFLRKNKDQIAILIGEGSQAQIFSSITEIESAIASINALLLGNAHQQILQIQNLIWLLGQLTRQLASAYEQASPPTQRRSSSRNLVEVEKSLLIHLTRSFALINRLTMNEVRAPDEMYQYIPVVHAETGNPNEMNLPGSQPHYEVIDGRVGDQRHLTSLFAQAGPGDSSNIQSPDQVQTHGMFVSDNGYDLFNQRHLSQSTGSSTDSGIELSPEGGSVEMTGVANITFL
jgi:hypothetical protein